MKTLKKEVSNSRNCTVFLTAEKRLYPFFFQYNICPVEEKVELSKIV